MTPSTFLGVLIRSVPVLLLALAGALLWRRHRSAATAMVCLGFAVELLGMVTILLAGMEYNALAGSDQNSFFVSHYYWLTQGIRWAGLLGYWVSAVGLVWYALRGRDAPTSPNNRSRVP